MSFCLSFSLFYKLKLFVFVQKATNDRIVVISFPIGPRSLVPKNLVVKLHLFIVMLKVTIGDYIVISLRLDLDLLASHLLLLGRLRSLAGRLKVMVLHVDVADDIVVNHRVFSRLKEPRFFLWIISTILKAFQLICKIHDVVGLLLPQGSILLVENDELRRKIYLLCSWLEYLLHLRIL